MSTTWAHPTADTRATAAAGTRAAAGARIADTASAAGGRYQDSSGDLQAFVVNETGGKWGKAKEVPGSAALNTGGLAQVLSASCASAGNCTAGGYYEHSPGNSQAFVADEAGGKWHTATYAGNADFTGSASAKKTLRVVR